MRVRKCARARVRGRVHVGLSGNVYCFARVHLPGGGEEGGI